MITHSAYLWSDTSGCFLNYLGNWLGIFIINVYCQKSDEWISYLSHEVLYQSQIKVHTQWKFPWQKVVFTSSWQSLLAIQMFHGLMNPKYLRGRTQNMLNFTVCKKNVYFYAYLSIPLKLKKNLEGVRTQNELEHEAYWQRFSIGSTNVKSTT